ncbi:MAG TPA: enoyl-CoA hydratase-related protein [Acidimicrobiales bacterium]|nr:enoyl-CoA hydratase-related protein [Acidimicrobiales bacterium]
MSEDEVLYEVDGPVATITLNRPDRLNTMNHTLLEAALAALEEAAGDNRVRALILTGAGRAFCAGGDLQGMAAGGGSPGLAGGGRSVETDVGALRRHMRTSQLLREMPKLTIAAINGACAGAGLAWACAADVRYASNTAVFNTAFMTAGLSGDFGGTWNLPRIVGPAVARELYLTAEKFGADEAERIGLVSKVVAPDELMGVARAKAERAAGFAPLTFAAIKANLNDSADVSFSEMLDREAARHIRCGRTEDAREAAAAFLEKRQPVFKGR